jgi:hypothetical protein
MLKAKFTPNPINIVRCHDKEYESYCYKEKFQEDKTWNKHEKAKNP